MSDEIIRATSDNTTTLSYTTKQFNIVFDQCTAKAQELGGDWTANKVQDAVWAWCVMKTRESSKKAVIAAKQKDIETRRTQKEASKQEASKQSKASPNMRLRDDATNVKKNILVRKSAREI